MLSKLWQKKKIKSHFKIAAPPGTVGELSIISVACDQHLCFSSSPSLLFITRHPIIAGSWQQGASEKVETQGENELICRKFKISRDLLHFLALHSTIFCLLIVFWFTVFVVNIANMWTYVLRESDCDSEHVLQIEEAWLSPMPTSTSYRASSWYKLNVNEQNIRIELALCCQDWCQCHCQSRLQ